jgi:hypothetical protein
MAEKEMSPAEREARQMIADKKAQEAATKAYNAASKTPPAPAQTVRRAKGGSVTRADGCIIKSPTRGKTIKMAYGGKAC